MSELSLKPFQVKYNLDYSIFPAWTQNSRNIMRSFAFVKLLWPLPKSGASRANQGHNQPTTTARHFFPNTWKELIDEGLLWNQNKETSKWVECCMNMRGGNYNEVFQGQFGKMQWYNMKDTGIGGFQGVKYSTFIFRRPLRRTRSFLL